MMNDAPPLLAERDARGVVSLTLNRPQSFNALSESMLAALQSALDRVAADDAARVVVIGATGRAFCAGLDIKEDYGQPETVWNHEDPGELLSAKWQKVWKPVVCAVRGMCTAGAFYFLNEADIVICSDDATFFDSHVTNGLVSAIEPVGLMRRIGLGETLRIALTGNDDRVSATTALRIGLVSEIVERPDLWARAHAIASPDKSAGAASGSATRANVRSGPAPRLRAAKRRSSSISRNASRAGIT